MPGPNHATKMLQTAWRLAAKCTCYSSDGAIRSTHEPWYRFQIQDAGIFVLITENGEVEIHDGQRCLQQDVDYQEAVINGQAYYLLDYSALGGTQLAFQLNGSGVELFRLNKTVEA